MGILKNKHYIYRNRTCTVGEKQRKDDSCPKAENAPKHCKFRDVLHKEGPTKGDTKHKCSVVGEGSDFKHMFHGLRRQNYTVVLSQGYGFKLNHITSGTF